MPQMKHNPFKDENDFGALLRRPAPLSPGALWIFPVIVVIGALFLALYPAASGPATQPVPLTPTFHRIDVDPDDARRQQYAPPAQPEERPLRQNLPGTVAEGHFRVCAAQIYSEIAQPDKNRRKMAAYAARAAELGARFIVFPEAALQGYADLERWHLWARDPQKAKAESDIPFFYRVGEYAESESGSEVDFFRELAREHGLYICLPYIEAAGDDFHSSLCLIDPAGTVVLRNRKHKLWAMADIYWAKSGGDMFESVQTPYGRVALAISYDIGPRLRAAGETGVNLLLHSSAFYGDNLERWMSTAYARQVAESGTAVVFATWGLTFRADWGGYGMSRIYDRSGKLLAARGTEDGEFLVVADLPLPAR